MVVLLATLTTACAGQSDRPEYAAMLSPGVPIELAEYRKASIADLRYEVTLSIPDAAVG